MTACSSPETSVLPPIAISGSVSDTALTRDFEGEPREYSNAVTGTLRARSYIWQPWFVTTEGGASVTHRYVEGGINDDNALIVSGDVKLGILPVSEYPTNLSYSHTDSRTDGTLGFDFIRDRYGFTNQAAVTDNLKTFTRLTYQTVDQEEVGDQEDIDAGFTATLNLLYNVLALDLQHSDSKFRASDPNEEDEDEEINLATLSHLYTPSTSFKVQNRLTYIDEADDQETQTRDRRSLQGVTQSFWRPDDEPYTVTGVLRALRDEVDFDDGISDANDSDEKLVSGVLGVNYPIMPRLTTNFGLNGTYEMSERDDSTDPDDSGTDGQRIEAGSTASLSYLSLESELLGFDWRWNGNTSAQGIYRRQEGSGNDGPQGSGSGSLGHSGSRTIDMLLLGPTRFAASQSGGVTVTSEDQEDDYVVPNLNHDVSFTISRSEGGTSTYARLSASDRREFLAEDAVEFQLVQFQLNRQAQIDLDDNWVAALSLQGSRRKERGESADYVASANGRIAYISRRVFGVNDLDFTSELKLNAIGLEDSLQLDEDDDKELGDDFRGDWTNKLSYRIGRITTSLEGSVFVIGEEFGNSVMLRIRRDFDGVF